MTVREWLYQRGSLHSSCRPQALAARLVPSASLQHEGCENWMSASYGRAQLQALIPKAGGPKSRPNLQCDQSAAAVQLAACTAMQPYRLHTLLKANKLLVMHHALSGAFLA